MKFLPDLLKPLVIAIVLTAGLSFVSAAWTGPTLPPPNGNVDVPLNVGTTSQSKIGSLLIKGLNSAGGALSTGFSVINGNVGIGTSTPRQKLSILGAVGASSFCTTDADGNCTGTIGAPALEYKTDTWTAWTSVRSFLPGGNYADRFGFTDFPYRDPEARCSVGKKVVNGGCSMKMRKRPNSEYCSGNSSCSLSSVESYVSPMMFATNEPYAKHSVLPFIHMSEPIIDGSGWVCGASPIGNFYKKFNDYSDSSVSYGIYSVTATAICQ